MAITTTKCGSNPENSNRSRTIVTIATVKPVTVESVLLVLMRVTIVKFK